MRYWLAKSVFSALYWFACFYLAVTLLTGDRVVAGRIVGPGLTLPPVASAVAAVWLYAALSYLWDRVRRRARR